MSPPNCASHTGPRLLKRQHTFYIVTVNFFAGNRIDDRRLDSKKWERCATRLGRSDPSKRSDNIGSSLRLPVCLNNMSQCHGLCRFSLTSTTWASSFPTISKYHFQTSAAIGSPTEPKTLKCFICALTCSSPARFSSLKAVGAT